MFHLFQTYAAFKCFILHVFYAVRRVRGRGEPVAGGRCARRLRAGGRGHDGAEVRLWGRGEQMWMGVGQASGRACEVCGRAYR